MASLRLLVEITIGATTYKISNEWISDLASAYSGHVMDFESLYQGIPTRHGGEFGIKSSRIGISQKFFKNVAADWPPSKTVGLKIYTTVSTEAAREFLLDGKGEQPDGGVSDLLVWYDVYQSADPVNVLDDGYADSDVDAYQCRTASTAWTISGAGPEYYMTTTPTGWPATKPDRVQINYAFADEGTVGALAVGEWGWSGGNLYARVTGDVDPDTKTAGYIRADYGTTVTALPRAFGEVEFRAPTRLPDVLIGATTYASYTAGHISGTPAKAFTAIANNGGGFARVTSAGHPFITNDVVTVEVQPNSAYNVTDIITKIDANRYDLTTTPYTATAVGHAYMPGYYRTYDSGIPKTGNTILSSANNLFYVTPIPSGEFTVSGTGYNDAASATITDLDDVGLWVKTRTGLTTFDNSVAEASSPSIAWWETEQSTISKWFSDVCAYYKHIFQKTDDTLFLIDMEQDNGTRTVTEFEVLLGVKHGAENKPASEVFAKWTTRNWQELQGVFGVSTDPKGASVPIDSTSFASPLEVKPFNTSRVDVESRLALIAAVLQRENVVFSLGERAFQSGYLPEPGSRYGFTDTYNEDDITVLARVVGREYLFNDTKVTLQTKQTT